MSLQLVECVPNFSEGRDKKVIDAICDAIRSVSGANLLDVDPGISTNRTVITMVGSPDACVEAAFQAIAVSARMIDMTRHHGEHPRMGACDVCPFVPVANITMQECAELAKRLGERVGRELGVPVYLYANAATRPDRYSLADIRQGEYEGLAEKMKRPDFTPDFGPSTFNAKSGATVIGARPFLIAYNVNLNTRSKKLANEIALNIREAGRGKRDDQGQLIKDDQGQTVKMPGTLKEVRAVGWFVEEYKRAQVSINLTDYQVTSMHRAFDEVQEQAARLGMRVTGSEIVGLVPLEPMLAAGRHYLARQGRSQGVSERDLIECAIQSLGLSDLAPFDPDEKIIEYKVAAKGKNLRDMSLSDFADELASESPAPGGGSTAALAGALSAALSAMVANLTFDKKGFEARRLELNRVANGAQDLKKSLLLLVDEDMQAFNSIIEARRMPKGSQAEKDARAEAIMAANKRAIDSPMAVLRMVRVLMDLAAEMIDKGNPNSLSDAGVAALMAAACGEGAYYNVLINIDGLKDESKNSVKVYLSACSAEANELIEAVRLKQHALHKAVLAKIGPSLINA